MLTVHICNSNTQCYVNSSYICISKTVLCYQLDQISNSKIPQYVDIVTLCKINKPVGLGA